MRTKIESNSNSIYKNTKKLLSAHDRKKARLFIAEGLRLVSDAVRRGADLKYIMVRRGYDGEDFSQMFRTYELDEKLFDSISSTVNSQGIIAVAAYPTPDSEKLFDESVRTVVYLDSVCDPGNMGTILRSADAFGADAVVLSKGCADIYSPKVVRSTMASLFAIPAYADDADFSLLRRLGASGFKVCGTFPDGDVYCQDADLAGRTVIVMGNEANGICEKTAQLCTERIKVPMAGAAESLNVAVCCSVMLYERLRQKIWRCFEI